MKIEQYSNIKPNLGVKKRSGAAAVGDFSDFLDIAEEAGSSASSISEAQNVANLSGIIAMQEVGDAEFAKKKLLKRGENLLSSLEDLRRNILVGRVPLSDLRDISQKLTENKEDFADPALKSIIDEIEIRAAVEVAKLEMAGKVKSD